MNRYPAWISFRDHLTANAGSSGPSRVVTTPLRTNPTCVAATVCREASSLFNEKSGRNILDVFRNGARSSGIVEHRKEKRGRRLQVHGPKARPDRTSYWRHILLSRVSKSIQVRKSLSHKKMQINNSPSPHATMGHADALLPETVKKRLVRVLDAFFACVLYKSLCRR